MPVVTMSRDYTGPDPSGTERIVGFAKAVLLTETGRLWIGPEGCHVAVFGDRILGGRLDGKRQNLEVFTGRRADPRVTASKPDCFAGGGRYFYVACRT